MSIFEEAARLERENIPFALVTITKSEGSTPRSQARMIVLTDGRTIGTVGGGASEHEAIKRAVELIPQGRSEILSMALTVASGHNCGGAVEMFVEVVDSAVHMVLVGGGHVNLEIARLAAACGFWIEVVETRPEFATPERFPWARRLHVGPDLETALSKVQVSSKTCIVIATHGLDRQALELLIGSGARYLGMLGSRTKVQGYRKHLLEDLHIPEHLLSHWHSPIGLDIGSETPEQIAVGVVSEMLMVINRTSGRPLSRMARNLVVIRGAGDLATGVICRMHKAGYRVLALEIGKPTTIRRTVAFSEAMYTGEAVVDGVKCRLAGSDRQAKTIMDEGDVALLCDPEGTCITSLAPSVVVDAIIAKKNVGTSIAMAPFVVALGPGFEAGVDCHCVIETKRGHDLGKVIGHGTAAPNTGIPGIIGGFGRERVLHSPACGVFESDHQIGEMVAAGEVIARVGSTEVVATIGGVLRGLLRNGLEVAEGFKIADVDPRGDISNCYSVSDKARAVGGAVLEAVDAFHSGRFERYREV